jgi:Tol biopolymer transport system component
VSNRAGRSWELFAIRADGRGERQLTHTTSQHYNENAPRYSNEGRRILYAHDGRIATIAADGRDIDELGSGTSADWR